MGGSGLEKGPSKQDGVEVQGWHLTISLAPPRGLDWL